MFAVAQLLTCAIVEIPPGIFGVALADSIKYANVAISLTDDHGDSFIYGYVPIVVAKCGVFLKEKGRFSSFLWAPSVLTGIHKQRTLRAYFD